MKSGGRTLTVTHVLVVPGRNWLVFFFFAVELCRFTSLFRGDRRVQGDASRVGGRLFRVCHDRFKHPHLLPHSLIASPGKKKDAHHAHRNLNLHPLGQLLLVMWVVTWVLNNQGPCRCQNSFRKEISPMFGWLFFELFLSCTLVN